MEEGTERSWRQSIRKAAVKQRPVEMAAETRYAVTRQHTTTKITRQCVTVTCTKTHNGLSMNMLVWKGEIFSGSPPHTHRTAGNERMIAEKRISLSWG